MNLAQAINLQRADEFCSFALPISPAPILRRIHVEAKPLPTLAEAERSRDCHVPADKAKRRTERILTLLRERPGLTAPVIRDAVGLHDTQATTALAWLQDTKRVRREGAMRKYRYFAA